MARPLYQSALEQPRTRGPDGHAGLWFDKFCDRWRIEDRSWLMSADDSGHNPKLDWLQSVAGGGHVGARAQIDEAALRLVRFIHKRGGRLAVFKTESRFVTGLGRSHPVENGFGWHPTLGTPYLPGSSIKGLVRSWAREQAEPRPDPKVAVRLLGGPARAGNVSFLDAVPTAPVQLDADVMTPHYAGWSEKEPPGDWCSPNPIPFLVTAVGTPFLFGVVPRHDLDGDDLDIVMRWLGDALTWAGAGAKTAVGYGRFRLDTHALDALWHEVEKRAEAKRAAREEMERLDSLTPLERELEELGRNQGETTARHVRWIKALQEGRWDDDPDTRRAVALKIKQEMERVGKWKPTSAKKRPERDRDHQRTLIVMKFIEG